MKISKTLVQTAALAATLALAPATAQAQTNQTVTSTFQNVTVGGVNYTAYDGTLSGENSGGGSDAVTSPGPTQLPVTPARSRSTATAAVM